MGAPAWYRAIPQPLRWAVGFAVALAAGGAVYGLAESVRDYPLSSWIAVTLYVSLLGAIAGFVVGVVAGSILRAARAAVHRS